MFYSHEVLTSRKHGVATVWLVATLGAKSTLKKVSRKAILDVDVAKACETIAQPEAPMALRLQSNLLYGVTRVYSQQCGYILTDAESARNNMRIMMRAIRQQVDLDKDRTHKANPDQLVLQDDPNFLPDLDLMPIDLDLRLGLLDDEPQSTLSPHGSQLTHETLQSVDGLMLPPSQSSLLGDPVGGGLDILSVHGDSGAGLRLEGHLLHDDDDLGLDIDKLDDELARQPRGPTGSIDRTNIVSDGVRAGILNDSYQPMFDQGAEDMSMQDGFMMANEQFAAEQGDGTPGRPKNQEEGLETTSESASAPLQKIRQRSKKLILQDKEISLRSSAVKNWQDDYLEKMREVILQKQGPKLTAIAKKNAAHWVLGTGGPLGQGMLSPLNIFSGAGLFEAFTGITFLNNGRKRAREEADTSSGSDRHVRARGEPSPNEAGRGLRDDGLQGSGLQDNGFVPELNMDDTIEYGREAPTPLDDRQLSSVFPWNQSAGSRRPTDFHPTSGSIGGMGPHINLLGRRGSRLTSASPLVGRGTLGDNGSDLYHPGSDNGMGGLVGDEEFELYGAAAQVDTQTAAQSQWQRAALGTESANFFTFVQNAINGAELPDDEDDGDMVDSTNFESLLPPATNSKIVAAQAFLHVLTLGNKNLFRIQQEEAFGPITMHIAAAA